MNIIKSPPPLTVAPGVIRGLSVSKGSGLTLSVEKGCAETAGGTLISIPDDLMNYLRVPTTKLSDRFDWVYIQSDGIYSDIRYHAGVEGNVESFNSASPAVGNGVLLAKILVKHPLTSPANIYIYNVVGTEGELVARGVCPLEAPNGVRMNFTFPLPVSDSFSLEMKLYGIRQIKDVDFSIENIQDDNGQFNMSRVSFNEPLPSGASLRADFYLGKSKYSL